MTNKPATRAQIKYVEALAKTYAASVEEVAERRAEIRDKIKAGTLTDDDCRRLIPLLRGTQTTPARKQRIYPDGGDYVDWSTPEGYDDSPDQGVHQYDGGGTFW